MTTVDDKAKRLFQRAAEHLGVYWTAVYAGADDQAVKGLGKDDPDDASYVMAGLLTKCVAITIPILEKFVENIEPREGEPQDGYAVRLLDEVNALAISVEAIEGAITGLRWSLEKRLAEARVSTICRPWPGATKK